MRHAFFSHLADLAKTDDRIYLLVGDLGFGYMDKFRATVPGQFINCGASEQAMVGIAAGLAEAGKIPFVYSISPFISNRAFEFVKLDVGVPQRNVKFVGVGYGHDYAFQGASHYANDDEELMKMVNILCVVVDKSASANLEEVVKKAVVQTAPLYIILRI